MPGGRIIEAIQNRLGRLIFVSLISCLVSSAASAAPASPGDDAGCVIRGVSLRKRSPELAVAFHVDGAFGSEVQDTIQSGLPRTLSFRIELYRPRLLLPDRRLGAWRLDHTIRYDNLRDEFLITRAVTPDEGEARRELPSIVLRGLPKAVAAAARVEGFPVPLEESPAPLRYLLRIRASMEPLGGKDTPWFGRLPLPLGPAFGQKKSEWYVQEFEY